MGRCSAHRLVDVMQPAENWHRLDRASDGTDGGPSRLQRQAPMWTFGAVVPNELGEHRPQMLLVKDDQVVEALVAQRPDDPLGDRIGARCLHRAEQRLDAKAPGPSSEVCTKVTAQ